MMHSALIVPAAPNKTNNKLSSNNLGFPWLRQWTSDAVGSGDANAHDAELSPIF